jgi:hypothetical protein
VSDGVESRVVELRKQWQYYEPKKLRAILLEKEPSGVPAASTERTAAPGRQTPEPAEPDLDHDLDHDHDPRRAPSARRPRLRRLMA